MNLSFWSVLFKKKMVHKNIAGSFFAITVIIIKGKISNNREIGVYGDGKN